jgi:ankyrin repeat protein
MRILPFLALFLLPPVTILLLGDRQQEEPEPPELVLAAEVGDLERIDRLLAGRGEVDLRDACRWTPLMKAALNGHEAVVRRLLREGADVNAEDKGGYTALMLAASNNHAAIVQLLAEAGARVDHRERTNGWSALEWARRLGHRETVRVLEVLGSR